MSELTRANIMSSAILLLMVTAQVGTRAFGFRRIAIPIAATVWAHRSTGEIMTLCGAGFVVVWLVAMAAHLPTTALAPFFAIWALTMVIGRVVALVVRAKTLRAAITPTDATAPTTATRGVVAALPLA